MINARNTVKICHASIVKRSALQKHFSSYRSFTLTRGSGWGNVSCQLKCWPFVICQLHFRPFRDGPLEKLWGGGEFSNRRNFFSLSNSLYEFFLGYSMNIF